MIMSPNGNWLPQLTFCGAEFPLNRSIIGMWQNGCKYFFGFLWLLLLLRPVSVEKKPSWRRILFYLTRHLFALEQQLDILPDNLEGRGFIRLPAEEIRESWEQSLAADTPRRSGPHWIKRDTQYPSPATLQRKSQCPIPVCWFDCQTLDVPYIVLCLNINPSLYFAFMDANGAPPTQRWLLIIRKMDSTTSGGSSIEQSTALTADIDSRTK